MGGVRGSGRAAVSGEVAFACEISEDRKHCSIVAAGRAEGRPGILVDLAPFYDHPRTLVARMAVLYVKHDPVAVGGGPEVAGGDAAAAAGRGRGAGDASAGDSDVAVAHGEFLDSVNDGRLAHLDQPPLTAAVRAAQQRPLAGAQAWEPKVAVDQGPLVAATLATWAFSRWEELATPGVWQV